MTILFAPMEGLLAHSLRDVLTQVGGIDRRVSKFIRITGRKVPAWLSTMVVSPSVCIRCWPSPACTPARARASACQAWRRVALRMDRCVSGAQGMQMI